jgi:hypothetical protein
MARVTTPPPPLKWLIAYRLFGVRLPEEHRAWVAEDVKSKLFPVWRGARTFLGLEGLVVLYAVAQGVMYHAPSFRTLKYLTVAAMVFAILDTGPMQVRRTLRWQRIDKQGRPVRPKGLGRYEHLEAAIARVLVGVLWVAGSAAFGYALRPAPGTFDSVACQTPDSEVMSLITGGLTHKKATFMASRSITYQTGTMVGGLLTEPNPKPGGLKQNFSYETWIVEAGQVYVYSDRATKSWSSFPAAPAADRVAQEAAKRVAQCVGDAIKK